MSTWPLNVIAYKAITIYGASIEIRVWNTKS